SISGCQAKPPWRSIKQASTLPWRWPCSSSAMARAIFDGPKPMPIRSWICMMETSFIRFGGERPGGGRKGCAGMGRRGHPQTFVEKVFAREHAEHRVLVRKIERLDQGVAAARQVAQHPVVVGARFDHQASGA